MRVEKQGAVETAEGAPPQRGSRETAEAQGLLNRYYQAAGLPTSGERTAETRDRLLDFQRERGLDETGTADATTLGELRRAVEWIEHERAQQDEGGGPADEMPHATHGTDPRARQGSPTCRPDTAAALAAARIGGGVTHATSGAGATARDDAASITRRAATFVEREQIAELLHNNPWLVPALDLAMSQGLTVVVGVGADGALVGHRAGLSDGIYFAPNGEIGVTVAGAAGIGIDTGASATFQVTILVGPPALLDGIGYEAGVGGGEILVGGASVVFDQTMEPIGVTGEVGIGVGLSPVDLFGMVSYGAHVPVLPAVE